MVKAHAGILETDSADQVQQRLGSVVAEVLEGASDRKWVEGHLRPLVGLAEAEHMRKRSPGARRSPPGGGSWKRSRSDSPLVLVFEDLHWADDSLLDFVDHLVDWAAGVPMLVVCTARPELLSRRPGWGGGKPNAATISLSPLSDDETARLVHALLERSVLPADVQSTLIERAGGNPLYAEEFARMVDELGEDGSGLRLPESVQGIIAARLDALPIEREAPAPGRGRRREGLLARPTRSGSATGTGATPSCSCTGSSGRSSCAVSGARPSERRASTSSATCSSVTSRTRRSRARRGRRSTREQRPGSNRWADSRITPRCSRTTT